MKFKIKNPTTNFVWLTSCLGLLLLVSVSQDISKDADLPTIISVAVGLSSLIVSLVAIAITILSGGSLTSTYNNINEISLTTKSLIENLKNYSNDLLEIKGHVKSISSNFILSSIKTTQQINQKTINREEFLESTSTMTVIAFIACSLSFLTNKPFKIKDATSQDDKFLEGYFLSSFGTFHMFDFIDMSIEEYTINITNVENVDNEYIKNLAAKIDGDFAEQCLKSIMKYFNFDDNVRDA